MNLIESINKHTKSEISEIHTAMPAVILEFNHDTCRAKVQPLVTKKMSNGDGVNYPQICNVPVFFPTVYGMQISFHVGTGDTCLLICCEEALDGWGKNPPKKSEFSLNNAIALVGFSTSENMNTADVREACMEQKLIIRGDVKIYGNLTADSYEDND